MIDSSLSLVAIGQGLVMNPAWGELAWSDRQDDLAQSVGASDVERLAIPAKLWAVIKAATEWLKVRRPAEHLSGDKAHSLSDLGFHRWPRSEAIDGGDRRPQPLRPEHVGVIRAI